MNLFNSEFYKLADQLALEVAALPHPRRQTFDELMASVTADLLRFGVAASEAGARMTEFIAAASGIEFDTATIYYNRWMNRIPGPIYQVIPDAVHDMVWRLAQRRTH